MSATARSNIDDNENLTCPITLQFFHDPVLAADGHVYEREAITKWILEYGTSPLTRESLNTNDLQPDNHLRDLAARARNGTMFCNTHENVVTLPLLTRVQSNRNMQAFPNLAAESQQLSITHSSYRNARKKYILGLSLLACPIVITTIVVLLLRFSPWKSKSTQANTSRCKTAQTLPLSAIFKVRFQDFFYIEKLHVFEYTADDFSLTLTYRTSYSELKSKRRKCRVIELTWFLISKYKYKNIFLNWA